MFVSCEKLWQSILNRWGATTQAQKDAFCAIVSTCGTSSVQEIVGAAVAPTAPPTGGVKVVVVPGALGQPAVPYYWTGASWVVMGGTSDNACVQNKAASVGVTQFVFGQAADGACVKELVTIAPSLCAELTAIPNGAATRFVGVDAANSCVLSPVPNTSFSGLEFGTGGNVTFTGNGTVGAGLVGTVTFPPGGATACDQLKGAPAGTAASFFGVDAAGACVVSPAPNTSFTGLELGTGGNVAFTGTGAVGSPLVGSVTFPTVPSTCDQVLASPVGFIAVAYGQDNAGGCVREAVTVAPTLCQEIAALPAGAIATVVGLDAAGSCVKGTVSGGAAPAAATDTVAGIAALNLGTNLPDDATNATDALTASGLAAILQQAGGNALTSAVCAATANCPVAVAPLAISDIAVCTNGGGYTGSIDVASVQIESATPLTGVTLQAFISGSWVDVGGPINTILPFGAPPGTVAISGISSSAHTPGSVQYIYYRLVSGGIASAPRYINTTSQVGQC